MDELIERITGYLWRVYGYPGEFGDVHPVTIEKYRADAAALVEEIERTHVLVSHDDMSELLIGIGADIEVKDRMRALMDGH